MSERARPQGGGAAIPAEVLRRIGEQARQNDAEGRFPHAGVELLRRHGVLQRAVDPGFTIASASDTIAAIARHDPALALVVAFQYGFTAKALTAEGRWPEQARRRLLQSIAQEGALVSLLASEPELGQVTLGGFPQTQLRTGQDGSLRLHGRKTYSTGAEGLRWLIVSATFPQQRGYGLVLVDRELAEPQQLRIEPTWDALGMRSTRSDDVVFDGVPVDERDILETTSPDGTRTLTPPGRTDWAQLLLSVIYQAQARAALDWFVHFLRTRAPSNLGAPLASLPRFQETVGRLHTTLDVNDALLERAVRAVAEAPEAETTWWQVASARPTITTNATEVVLRIAEQAGNRGLQASAPIGFHLRNIVHSKIHGPNEELLFQSLGRAALQSSEQAP